MRARCGNRIAPFTFGLFSTIQQGIHIQKNTLMQIRRNLSEFFQKVHFHLIEFIRFDFIYFPPFLCIPNQIVHRSIEKIGQHDKRINIRFI